MILLCLVYFALIATNTVGIQQFAVPAWESMFGVTQTYAAICLMVFVVGSAAGMLPGGYIADRIHHHERVAAIGLLDGGRLYDAGGDDGGEPGVLPSCCSPRASPAARPVRRAT